jgi:ActR/RegA family two-component response regulator
VTVAATVAEALSEITSRTFDVLISDLNIGEPGDGFTVVSAMRRTQPECLTLILTGYPAFETALQAIHSQVDDFLIKPTPVPKLLNAIDRNLQFPARKSRRVTSSKRISDVLRENVSTIVQRTLAAIKEEPELAAVRLTDEQRVYPYPLLVQELAEMLESSEPNGVFEKRVQTAALRGQVRRLQGYSIPMVIASLRLFENAVYETIDENLLTLDISFVLSDIRRLGRLSALQLEQTIRSFQQAGRRLVFEGSEKWTGWFCERCCWNRPAPPSESERATLAFSINAEFDAHDCEAFAQQHLQAASL